jgi:hypothetical protein
MQYIFTEIGVDVESELLLNMFKHGQRSNLIFPYPIYHKVFDILSESESFVSFNVRFILGMISI